jgi:hypothetical protein
VGQRHADQRDVVVAQWLCQLLDDRTSANENRADLSGCEYDRRCGTDPEQSMAEQRFREPGTDHVDCVLGERRLTASF